VRIGELASRAGVSVRSLRYYEEQELLTSTRTTSGQRQYDESAVEHVIFLQRMYAGGLSSKTILELMPCTYAPSEANSDAAYDRMIEERAKLDRHIDELLRTRDTLDGFIAGNRAHRESLVSRSA
jgi:DNA-binding transcriptional MerR regulator